MMIKKNNTDGYILVLTLALIALCMFLSSYVYYKGFMYTRFSATMVDREKARQLAYGGIQLAISQLSLIPKKAEAQQPVPGQKGTDQKKEPGESDAQLLIKTLLPTLNAAQKFTLKQAIEGVNGTLIIAMGSEEGKISINKLYDFQKHKFIGEGQAAGDMKVVTKEIFNRIKDAGYGDLYDGFEKFLKERKYPLNDVTELLTVPGFESFRNDIFYDPAQPARDKKEKIYLTDLFTVASPKKELDPWLFSESLKVLLKLKSENKINLEAVLKNFKEQSNWKTDWAKTVQNLYGVDYGALPKPIAGILNPAFAPKMFWVLSQATVGMVTVSVWALLEREKGSGKDAAPVVKIRKVYLI